MASWTDLIVAVQVGTYGHLRRVVATKPPGTRMVFVFPQSEGFVGTGDYSKLKCAYCLDSLALFMLRVCASHLKSLATR